MSSFLFSASIILVLLSILPFSTADQALDIIGDPILNGWEYHIIPIATTTGLTYTQKHEECPLYITPEKTENSRGTPITISTTATTFYILLNQPIRLSFTSPTPCDVSPLWRQTLDPFARKLYITTGDQLSLPASLPFSITKLEDNSLEPTYALMFSPDERIEDSFYVGLHENGLLGITKHPTLFYFKRAYTSIERLPMLNLSYQSLKNKLNS